MYTAFFARRTDGMDVTVELFPWTSGHYSLRVGRRIHGHSEPYYHEFVPSNLTPVIDALSEAGVGCHVYAHTLHDMLVAARVDVDDLGRP